MSLLTIRRVGLTLVLLLSSLASAPFGSMEQAATGVPEQLAALRTLPAPTTGGRLRAGELWIVKKTRAPGGIHGLHHLFPLPALLLDAVLPVSVSPSARVLASRVLPPRICECRSYDATAPPALG